jgi:hypothetical protein
MADAVRRRLLVWEARHDDGRTDAGPRTTRWHLCRVGGAGEAIGVDYVEDTPEHAQAAAMFALKRKSGHAECLPRCSDFEMRTHTMLVALTDGSF